MDNQPQNVINSDIPAILSTLDQKALLRPDNPPPGFAGFIFDVVGDEMVELQSDITDHYVENNTALQDQIALRPEKITIRGIVAELTTAMVAAAPFNPPPNPLPVNQPMKPPTTPGTLQIRALAIAKTLTTQAGGGILAGVGASASVNSALKNAGQTLISGLADKVSSVADSAVRLLMEPANLAALVKSNVGSLVALPGDAQAAVNVLKSVVPNQVTSLLGALKTPSVPSSQQLLAAATPVSSATPSSVFQNYQNTQPTPPKQTRQSSALLYFYNCWKQRQLFTVQTAWGIWTSCAIENFKAEQPEDTRGRTDFTLTLKRIRIAGDLTTQLGQLAGRNAMQAGASNPTNNGVLGQGPSQDDSVLKATFGHP